MLFKNHKFFKGITEYHLHCSSMAASEVTLKLLIDIKNHKVLFAEAGKDFVDFLFTLLALPLGTVTSLLETKSMVGCLGDLYESIKNLSQTYIEEGKDKNSVLKPTVRTNGTPMLPNIKSFSPKVYACPSNCIYKTLAANNPNTSCPYCCIKMSLQMDYDSFAEKNIEAKTNSDGRSFVKGVVTYMVMDNLEVAPMSTISSVSLLSKFDIKNLNAVEEKAVEFGMTEGLELLKASLQTKSVLTNIFLGKKDSQVHGSTDRNKRARQE